MQGGFGQFVSQAFLVIISLSLKTLLPETFILGFRLSSLFSAFIFFFPPEADIFIFDIVLCYPLCFNYSINTKLQDL